MPHSRGPCLESRVALENTDPYYPMMSPSAVVEIGRRRRWLPVALSTTAVAAAIIIVLVVRYITFDPKLFVSEVDDRLNPLRPKPAGSASHATSLLGPAPSDKTERVRQLERTIAELHQRYHTSAAPCFRYPSKEDVAGAPEKADEVADALLAADLAGRLDALMLTAAQWARDADTATHALSAAGEVVEYFANQAGLWTRLGVAMHRHAVDEAAKAVVEPRLPPLSGTPLSPEEEARAKPLWERYGHLQLLQGAMRVGMRMHVVDLRAPQLRLLEPGMSESAVRARLGTAEEDGDHWRYPRFGTEVSFKDGRVTGIATNLAPGDQVIVDGAAQRDLGEASVVRLMGRPLREGQGERGESMFVYGAGPHAVVLVFLGQLGRVELWRKDLVVPAAP
jgi:hypothetical protein